MSFHLARAWAPQGDVWGVLDELGSVEVGWNDTQVRRLWFCTPLALRVAPVVWSGFARSSGSPEVFWRRSQSEVWIRLLLPRSDQNTLGELRAHRRELPGHTAQLARDALGANEERPLRSTGVPPMWLRAATADDFALWWRELALELELWPSVMMSSLFAQPTRPDHELRDWEKAPGSETENDAATTQQRKVA